MKKFSLIVIACIAVLIVGACVFLMLGQGEPEWEGRPLSALITEVAMHHSSPACRLSLQNSDTNFVPLLVKWLVEPTSGRPALKTRIIYGCNRGIGWLRAHGMSRLTFFKTSYLTNVDHPTLAMWALPELSSAGKKAAVTRLIFLISSTNEDIAGTSCFMLSKMTPESIDPLLAEMDASNGQSRGLAAAALGMMGTNAAPAIPALKKMLSDPQIPLRVQAATALTELGDPPANSVPAILQAFTQLKDPETILANINSALKIYSKKVNVPLANFSESKDLKTALPSTNEDFKNSPR